MSVLELLRLRDEALPLGQCQNRERNERLRLRNRHAVLGKHLGGLLIELGNLALQGLRCLLSLHLLTMTDPPCRPGSPFGIQRILDSAVDPESDPAIPFLYKCRMRYSIGNSSQRRRARDGFQEQI